MVCHSDFFSHSSLFRTLKGHHSRLQKTWLTIILFLYSLFLLIFRPILYSSFHFLFFSHPWFFLVRRFSILNPSHPTFYSIRRLFFPYRIFVLSLLYRLFSSEYRLVTLPSPFLRIRHYIYHSGHPISLISQFLLSNRLLVHAIRANRFLSPPNRCLPPVFSYIYHQLLYLLMLFHS